MSTENKFDTSAFIAKYMDAYGQEPSYEVVVNAAVEQLKFENEQLKKLMSVQIDMLEQNKKLTRTLELENMASAQLIAEIEQLKAELAYYKNGRQMKEIHYDDPTPYIAELTALKSKLKIAVEALVLLESFGYITQFKYIKQALTEIGGEI